MIFIDHCHAAPAMREISRYGKFPYLSTFPSRGEEVYMARRTFGFILTVIAVFTAGYQLAWNRDVIERLGGFGGLLGAVVFISFGVLAVFWPDRWGSTGRRVVTAGALVGFFFGSDFAREAFDEAPVATTLWIVGGLAAVFILYCFTVFDGWPTWNWLSNLRSRMATAPVPTVTP